VNLATPITAAGQVRSITVGKIARIMGILFEIGRFADPPRFEGRPEEMRTVRTAGMQNNNLT
jgi:hypothetical protein